MNIQDYKPTAEQLTEKEIWILNFLKTYPSVFLSPSYIGSQYGLSIGKLGFHSASASPTLLRLTKIGLIERNSKGHYKIKL